ncbi:hypothetical protein [Pimelobacter simplex]|uniref:Vgb family protein n=1 Tax=Nocardioides simplex TaxID=2045 RepID=UPI003AAF848B
MRRAAWTLTTAIITLAVGLPLLGTVPPAGAGPGDPAEPTALVARAHPDRVTVRRSPAPPRPAQRAGALRVFPVPTSSAGLERITTAPDGSMWFVEGGQNKVGRITTAGAITEFTLPAQTSDDSTVMDLEVDSSGRVWVVWDSGWRITRFHPSSPSAAFTWNLSYPYGEEVRMGPGGAAWVTLSFDEQGILKIVGDTATWDDNAPPCDGALGRGRDDLMWCQDFDKLIQVNAGGTGGRTYPMPDDATYPYSVATGPHQRIWFGRYEPGSWASSPSWGNVGWVGTDNAVHTIRTGDRTAPRSLTLGRDGNVWFASIGATVGIGHVNAAGQGAIARVGNFRPRSVTYGADGAIWFTDRDANAIVRVTRDQLWVTNVDVGDRNQLRPHPQPRATAVSARLDADKRRRKAPLTVACAGGLVACRGSVVVKAGRKTVGTARYAVAPGRRATVPIALSAAARKLLGRKKKVKVVVILTSTAGQRTSRAARLTR